MTGEMWVELVLDLASRLSNEHKARRCIRVQFFILR